MDDSIKQIIILPKEKKTRSVVTEKPKIKRVITETTRWKESTPDYLDVSTQSSAISRNTEITEVVDKQIRRKIAGYKTQDVEKSILDKELFVCFQDVLNLFQTSSLNCYYCQEGVLILYEHVRNPKQWTLERLDNSRGHNRDNVVLACLHCNLRRRCMQSDRYLKTKQMATIKKID